LLAAGRVWASADARSYDGIAAGKEIDDAASVVFIIDVALFERIQESADLCFPASRPRRGFFLTSPMKI